MNKNLAAVATVGFLALAATSPAFAAYDLTDAIAEVSLGEAAIGLLCSALLVMTIVKKVWGKLGGR